MAASIGRLARVAGLCLLASCQKAPAFTAQDETQLRGMFDGTATDFKTGNFEAWSKQFSEDAVMQPPNAKPVHGRPALLAWAQAFPKVQELSFSNVQVTGSGDWAFGTSDYVLQVQGAPADTGKQLVVFRRGAGGWEIPAVSFRSNLAPMTPPPAAAPAKPNP